MREIGIENQEHLNKGEMKASALKRFSGEIRPALPRNTQNDQEQIRLLLLQINNITLSEREPTEPAARAAAPEQESCRKGTAELIGEFVGRALLAVFEAVLAAGKGAYGLATSRKDRA
jgi:hypothetical protein